MFSIPFEVEKSLLIDVSPSRVYEVISDFSTWPKWSPWLCQEPTCPVDIQGQAHHVGHRQKWDGQHIGSGSMEIKSLEKDKSVRHQLTFLKPWKSSPQTEFAFENVGGKTNVTWKMKGSVPLFLFFLKKMMGVFVGMDYERGLKLLKDFLENGEVHNKVQNHGEVSCQPLTAVGVRRQCSFTDISSSMEEAFSELMKLKTERNLPEPDCYLSVYQESDPVKNTVSYLASLGYRDSFATETAAPLEVIRYSTHRALQVDHLGPYRHLGNAWSTLYGFQRAKKLKVSKAHKAYELYLVMPDEGVAEKDVHTSIHLPLREA